MIRYIAPLAVLFFTFMLVAASIVYKQPRSSAIARSIAKQELDEAFKKFYQPTKRVMRTGQRGYVYGRCAIWGEREFCIWDEAAI